jgi:hypothetical protein
VRESHNLFSIALHAFNVDVQLGLVLFTGTPGILQAGLEMDDETCPVLGQLVPGMQRRKALNIGTNGGRRNGLRGTHEERQKNDPG